MSGSPFSVSACSRCPASRKTARFAHHAYAEQPKNHSPKWLVALAVNLLLVASVAAQSEKRWSKLYDELGQTELVGGVCQLPDSTYMICTSWGTGQFGHLTPTGISVNGDTLWRKRISVQASTMESGTTWTVQRRSDGNIVWAGGLYPIDSSDSDGALYCFTAEGDSLWFRSFTGATYQGFNGMCLLPDDGACLVGISSDTQPDIWVVRTDGQGDTLWTRKHGNASNETGFSVVYTQDGGFAVGAYRWITNDNVATLLMKIDANGDLLWQRTYGTPWRDNAAFVTELPDGTFAIATGFGIAPVPNLAKRAALIRTDELGIEQWTAVFQDTVYSVFTTAPLVLPGGDFVAAGSRWPPFENIKGMLVEMSPTGTVLWERNYLTNPNIDQYIYDLRRTLDGGFIMAGTAFDTVPPLSQDAWLIKTDSFGCIVPGCQVFDAVLEQYTSLQGALQVSPNPTSDVVQVSIDLPPGLVAGNDAVLTLVDAQGRKVMEQALPTLATSHPHTLSLSHLPSGLYFLHLTNGTRWLAGARVVKQ